MAIAELGTGFSARVTQSLHGVDRLGHRKLALLAAMVQETGYALPAGAGTRATKLSRQRISLLLSPHEQPPDVTPSEESLAAFLELDTEGSYIFARFGHVMLDPLLRAVPVADTVALLIEFFRRMSPFLSKETQQDRTYPARTLAAMMRANALTRWVGPERLEELYVGIKPQYDWNGRYWEQRAIASLSVAERTGHAWGRASSFAEKAVELSDDGHRNNTLGNILLKRAAGDESLDLHSTWTIYDRAIKALLRARQLQAKNSVPFLTFLQAAPRLADRLSDRFAQVPETENKLLDDWPIWYEEAEASGAFITVPLRAQLRKFERAWVRP